MEIPRLNEVTRWSMVIPRHFAKWKNPPFSMDQIHWRSGHFQCRYVMLCRFITGYVQITWIQNPVSFGEDSPEKNMEKRTMCTAQRHSERCLMRVSQAVNVSPLTRHAFRWFDHRSNFWVVVPLGAVGNFDGQETTVLPCYPLVKIPKIMENITMVQ